MAKKPDTPCAGGCGKLLWSGSSSLPAGQRTCRSCRAARPARPSVERKRKRVEQKRSEQKRSCVECSSTFVAARTPQRFCSMYCRHAYRRRPIGEQLPDRQADLRSQWRRKNHRRRAVARLTDLTSRAELALRVKARRCPVCSVKMVDTPWLPNSKELDHIVPIGVGGTHTMGNVRIICRSCNLRRPKDGSDYVGQVTLWAQDQNVAAALPGRKRVSSPRGCAQCGQPKPKGRERCYACLPKKRTDRQEDGHRAAELRADGTKWQAIADALGFTNTGAAYLCAEKWGDPEVVARWPGRYVHSRS